MIRDWTPASSLLYAELLSADQGQSQEQGLQYLLFVARADTAFRREILKMATTDRNIEQQHTHWKCREIPSAVSYFHIIVPSELNPFLCPTPDQWIMLFHILLTSSSMQRVLNWKFQQHTKKKWRGTSCEDVLLPAYAGKTLLLLTQPSIYCTQGQVKTQPPYCELCLHSGKFISNKF